ncbi:metal ABC transporter permease [Thalassotalea maritima]|uniref:metal ABC transporter permease n=1 Tax=Thalassotalea maritima TaxID=3242416 RepID=UPI0035276EA6
MLDILLPALVAGLLVLLTHIPLGFQVLQREIIFIDLAIAQVAGLGAVMVAASDIAHHIPMAQYSVAVSFALVGAGAIAVFEKYARQHLEALIGCLYVLSATGAFLLLANDPHGADLLKQVLSGQILWVTFTDLYPHMALYAAALLCFVLRPHWLQGKAFYFMFALIITSSVQMVGVFLVFSCLIIPALATTNLTRYRYLWAYLVGATAFVVGLAASVIWDLPSGASVVWALACCAVIFVSVSKLVRAA